jgi:hypothetical protein
MREHVIGKQWRADDREHHAAASRRRVFDKIMEGLAMPNGVQKMTRRLRQHSILAKVL